MSASQEFEDDSAGLSFPHSARRPELARTDLVVDGCFEDWKVDSVSTVLAFGVGHLVRGEAVDGGQRKGRKALPECVSLCLIEFDTT